MACLLYSFLVVYLYFFVSNLYLPYTLIPLEKISRVHFLFHIIQALVIPVSDDCLVLLFEFIQIIYDLTSEESIPLFQNRIVNNYCSSLCLNTLRNALYAALPEVITVTLHGEPIHANNDFFFPTFIPRIVCTICTSNLQYTVCYEIFPLAGSNRHIQNWDCYKNSRRADLDIPL